MLVRGQTVVRQVDRGLAIPVNITNSVQMAAAVGMVGACVVRL